METLVVDQVHLENTILILKYNKKILFLYINEEDMPMVQFEQPLFLVVNGEEQIKASEDYGTFSINISLTYLKGLKIAELTEKDPNLNCNL